MQSLRGVLNFTRTAELGSFAAAEKELGVSSVAISQNIGRLEESLGVRLFSRSTRALKLTPEGKTFLEQCKGPLAQLEAACKDVSSEGSYPSGRLRASVASPFASEYLVPSLPEFYERYPEISLELEFSEEVSPLIGKRCDIGIRVGALNDANFVARPLGPVRLLLCTSPSYLESEGNVHDLDDLAQRPSLLIQAPGKEQPMPFILKNPETKGVQMLTPPTKLLSNDFRSLLRASEDGLGIAQLPQPMALPALKAGRLKTVLQRYELEAWQLFIHYPSRKQLPARVRAFVDFCIERFSNHPDLMANVDAFSADS